MAVTSFPKSEIKILLLENIHSVAADAFREEGFAVETVKGSLNERELVERVRDVHVLGIRSKTQITPPVLEAARRMLAVGAHRAAGGLLRRCVGALREVARSPGPG